MSGSIKRHGTPEESTSAPGTEKGCPKALAAIIEQVQVATFEVDAQARTLRAVRAGIVDAPTTERRTWLGIGKDGEGARYWQQFKAAQERLQAAINKAAGEALKLEDETARFEAPIQSRRSP